MQVALLKGCFKYFVQSLEAEGQVAHHLLPVAETALDGGVPLLAQFGGTSKEEVPFVFLFVQNLIFNINPWSKVNCTVMIFIDCLMHSPNPQ